MKKLDDVSTRELLETLRRRGAVAGPTPDEHLEADAEHLIKCLSPRVLNYPYPADV